MKDLKRLITQMTLEEKASFCSGQDFWHLKSLDRLGIPAITVADGPHGLRVVMGDPTGPDIQGSAPATCFPTASALAATWNRDLVYQVGQALAEECKEQGVSVLLGPGANIKRSPLCGRNFEYFSEDPYLSGELAKNHIRGAQSLGIGTSLKHYAANNQEYRRMTINAVMDERALREIYLAGFEIAVKEAQPWTVMGAYNRVNGVYACEHTDLLTRILREEWGFLGVLITDWGAMNDRVEALAAGMDIEMPGPNSSNDTRIAAAVREGWLDEKTLDQALERILSLAFRAQKALEESYQYDQDAHHTLARRAAGEGAVLLKNEGQSLPLERHARVALIGQMARTPRYQGAGSSLVNPSRMENVHDEMTRISGEAKIRFTPGYPEDGLEMDPILIAEALEAAREADAVVVCAGLPDRFEVEGLDREHLRLPESQNRLIEALAAEHDRVIVVLSNGAPVEMPWIDQVQAVLEGYLGGQAGGGAAAEILYGLVNPSGKLGETFPLRLEDTPAYPNFPGGPSTVEYRESLYVGYRFYDSVEKEVLFPFGHGLSYTSFAYSELTLSDTQISDLEELVVSLRVKNTGKLAGKEIVQLYIQPLNPLAYRPEKELKGFEKIDLEPGEEKEVRFSLDRRAFATYSTGLGAWHVQSGQYQLLVGASSRDIRCKAAVTMESGQPTEALSDRDRHPAYAEFPPDAGISQADFETLLGGPVPENLPDLKGSYTVNTPVSELRASPLGRLLGFYLDIQLKEMIKEDPDSSAAQMTRAVVEGMPLRSLVMMGGGRVSRDMVDEILEALNGGFFKGLARILRLIRKIL